MGAATLAPEAQGLLIYDKHQRQKAASKERLSASPKGLPLLTQACAAFQWRNPYSRERTALRGGALRAAISVGTRVIWPRRSAARDAGKTEQLAKSRRVAECRPTGLSS
jgi:hypothetical protein